jgi:hypothetical protein
MTSSSVSNQGFTVHNYRCGINFLSHLRGAPHSALGIRDGMSGDGDICVRTQGVDVNELQSVDVRQQ